MPAMLESNRTIQEALFTHVFRHDIVPPNVLMGMPGPRRKVDSAKQSRTDEHMPLHMERLEFAKQLKMLSLSPSIYGNIYGVLANS